MRLLVLGGTVFVSYAVAAEGVRRGHEVICAARGTSGPVPPGAKLVAVDRDAPDGLEPLAGEHFDGVIDVAKMSHTWVARAVEVLGAGAAHWTFVSSISVYADLATPGQTPADQVLEPVEQHVDDVSTISPQLYGSIKVASENTVLAALTDRAFIVRPGLITGPGDGSDRFGYWPARMARGGRVVVPDTPDLLTQIIDVRDLATWIITATEQRVTGVYDAISEPLPVPEMLDIIVATVGAEVELVHAAPDALEAAKVDHWGGPRSLPLWLPADHYGMAAHDPALSLAAGLIIRPHPDAVLGALEHERSLGLDRPRKAGLSVEEEAEVLAGL